MDKTTPLEALISVTQLYACLSCIRSGITLLTSSVGKLRHILWIVEARMTEKQEDWNHADVIVNQSLLKEAKFALRNVLIRFLIAPTGVAFWWLFLNSFHITLEFQTYESMTGWTPFWDAGASLFAGAGKDEDKQMKKEVQKVEDTLATWFAEKKAGEKGDKLRQEALEKAQDKLESFDGLAFKTNDDVNGLRCVSSALARSLIVVASDLHLLLVRHYTISLDESFLFMLMASRPTNTPKTNGVKRASTSDGFELCRIVSALGRSYFKELRSNRRCFYNDRLVDERFLSQACFDTLKRQAHHRELSMGRFGWTQISNSANTFLVKY
jgi:hypothetical protein